MLKGHLLALYAVLTCPDESSSAPNRLTSRNIEPRKNHGNFNLHSATFISWQRLKQKHSTEPKVLQ
jgi:hypothetical protein